MSDLCRLKVPYGSQTTTNKGKKGRDKTVRIAKKLPQTNEDTFPEYNFKDELDAFKKKKTKVSENGFHMSDDEMADDVRRIAKEMEEKYGKSSCSSKKRRRGHRDDYADIGMGYDESDSFIDNTDGYDEIIPQNVTTLHGGFYINCGALEFKADEKNGSREEDDSTSSSSSSSSDEDEGEKTPRNVKRPLESDGSEDDAKENSHQEKKLKESNGMQKAIRRKLFSQNKIHVKKKKQQQMQQQLQQQMQLQQQQQQLTPTFTKTVKSLLIEKRKDLNLSMTSTPISAEENSVKTGLTSYNDTIESVVKASDAEPKKIKSSQDADVQLPENLPSNILDAVNRCRQVPLGTGGEKFTEDLNNVLLSMERKCKCLGKPSKMKVYKYLSHHMKVDLDTLTKHCSNLLLQDEEKKIRNLLHKMKKEIDSLMPEIVKNYEKDCELVFQKRTMLQSQEGGKEKAAKIGRPKRKFQWNDQTRKLLKETATLRRRCFLLESKPKELWEDEMTLFLKTKVLNLWPEGWMTIVSLTKVYYSLLNLKAPENKTANNVTATATNPKKEITATKSTAPVNSPSFSAPATIKVSRELEITPIATPPAKSFDEKPERENNNAYKRSDTEKLDAFPRKDVQLFGPSKEVTFTPISSKSEDAPVKFAEGDDFATVMESLKTLHKLSSPIKSFDCAQRSSVLKHPESSVGFQEEFKRQLYNPVQVAPGTSKSNYKFS